MLLPMLNMAKVLHTFAAMKSLQTTPSAAPIHFPLLLLSSSWCHHKGEELSCTAQPWMPRKEPNESDCLVIVSEWFGCRTHGQNIRQQYELPLSIMNERRWPSSPQMSPDVSCISAHPNLWKKQEMLVFPAYIHPTVFTHSVTVDWVESRQGKTKLIAPIHWTKE